MNHGAGRVRVGGADHALAQMAREIEKMELSVMWRPPTTCFDLPALRSPASGI